MKLNLVLLIAHVRTAILRDGVRSVTAFGSFHDTWIIDMTAGHLTDQKLWQLASIASEVDYQDKGEFTRLIMRF